MERSDTGAGEDGHAVRNRQPAPAEREQDREPEQAEDHEPAADHSRLPRRIRHTHLAVDRGRYFWFHHTDADTIDKLNPQELQECIAYTAVLAFIVADMPERLPR